MMRVGLGSNRMRIGLLTAGLGALLAAAGCDHKTEAAQSARSEASASAVTAAPAKVPVARVVFVGQKDCCKCTRDRIQASWTALEQALAARPGIAVERLEIDVDEAQVVELEKLGKTMVVPGLYFLAVDGKLVKLLQGEVTKAQLEELL